GRFAIDANSGIITVNGGLDYELNSSHSVTVLATSSDGSTSNQVFTANVTDVDEGVVDEETTTTDPPIEEPDPIEDVTPDDPNPDPDDSTDPLLDEDPQDFEEITIVPDLTETDDLIALEGDPTVELAEELSDSVEELRSGSAQERPENDRSYRYFDNNLYKEVLSNTHLDYQYQAPDNVLHLDEFDDFSTIDFDSDNMDKVIASGEYDLLREEIDEAFNKQFKSEAVKTKVVTMATATFTIGIVSYLLRAGSLAAALASSLPLWRGFDPIIVFTGDKKKEKDPNEISDPDDLKLDTIFEDDAE
ncbi:MAG: cadherin repeat domain-containing protein, partial [Desulfuromusa sp.]|nr:cadherin repeat domain-containing protein [Desulfuromusa sp.]